MRNITRIALLLSWQVMISSLAAQSGDEILKKVEDTVNAPKDRVAVQKMTLIDKDGTQKVRKTKTYQKGDEKRLIRFLYPADVRGVGLLVLSEDRIYLYMPALHKIRRVASSIKDQNFMGTDFSYEDMAQVKFSDDYHARLVQEDSLYYVLELTPKSGADVSYAKEILSVDKKSFLPVRSDLYSKDGNLVKVIKMENLEKIDGYWTPIRIEAETVKSGHRTIIELEEIQHDTGLSDKVFTQRNLKKL